MRNTMRRLTSLLCVLALCLSLLPASALAADENAEPAPEGVVEDTLPTEPEPEESAEPEEEVTTFAEGDVAQIGDQTYATLGAAIDAANESAEPVTIIEVLQSCTLDKAIAIKEGKNVTITAQEDTNIVITDDSRKGVTLSTNTTLTVENLTINTNGQIYLNGKGGTLTFTNVDLSMDGELYQFNNDGYYCCAISIEQPESSLTFDGCNVYIKNYPSSGSAIRWNGSGKDSGYNVSILNGTTLTSTKCYSGFVGTCDIVIEDSTVNVLYHRGNGSNGSYYDIRNSTVNYTGNGSHGISAGGITVSDQSTVTSDNNGMYGIYAENIFEVDGTSKVTVTRNSAKGDYAGLKIRPNVKAGLVEAGAEITITGNYCSGLSNNGVLTFEEGAKLTITGNNNDKGTSSHGGGIYNSGAAANLTLPSDAVIYNNHSKTDGDDIFNNTTATITFGEVGSGWMLDGGPDCTDAIDGWYDDSEDARWEAHDAPYHAERCRLYTDEEYPTATYTGLLALKAAHGLTPLEPGEETGDWECSKSKTATNLDSNFESDVTLSLPAADYEPTIDVVFVIDDTSAGSSIFEGAVNSLLDELVAKENLDVNVGVIAFDAVARDWLDATSDTYSGLVSLKDSSALDALKTAIGTELSSSNEGYTRKIGASNTEWPMELAQEMLAKGNGTEQHVIVFSDMYGYVYRGVLAVGNTSYSGVPLSKRLAGYNLGQLCISPPMFDTWEEVYAGYDEDDRTLDTFFRDTSWNDYWTIYKEVNSAPNITEAHQNSAPQYNPNLTPYVYFTPFEKSSCLTYDRILKLLNGDIQVTIVNNNFNPGANGDVIQGIKNGMLDALESQGVLVIQEDTPNGGEFTSDQMGTIFSKLENKLVQLVDAGSYVVDEIGSGTDKDGNDYNFDFVNSIDSPTLTVDGASLDKVEVTDPDLFFTHRGATAAYIFGNEETPDQFELYYYPDGTIYEGEEYGECFIWEINVPVTKDAPVQLTYAVKLKNPQEAEGTYGQYDEDGSKDYDGLFTNNSATLYPVDSNGQPGRPENFAKPTVSYTVGTVTITPADITIYMGGDEGYEAVVGGDGAIAETTNSLPRPMFLVDAPEGVNPEGLEFVSSETFTGTDGQQYTKTWTLELAGTTGGENPQNLYYMNAEYAAQGQDEVRVQFTQENVVGAEPIISDSFNPTDVNEMFVDYDIELYTGTVQTGGITVTGENGVRYALGEVGTGTLRVRAVDDTEGDNNPVVTVTETIGEPVKAGEGAVTAPDGTAYTLNDTTVPVEADGVGLLFDGIIDDGANRTQALKDKVDATMGAPGRNTTRHYQAQYLDLVDAHNGNAWVKASGEVTVYWGYPSGTNQNTDFTLYHFEGLHRDDNDGQSGFDINEVAGITPEEVEIDKDANGISFQVTPGGFSPFVLVYETVEDDEDDDYNPPHRPSNPDKDDDEDDEPEDLNTEDHVAYIIGYTDSTVRPQGNIARSEVATIFFRLLTDEARETYWSQTNPYSDVAPDAWYNNAISTLTNMGILDGYLDGTFRPTAPITRSEFTKIAVSFFDYADEHFVYDGRFSDVEGNEWYVNFLAAAIEYGLIEGMPDGTFHPLDNITRAEACTIVNRTLGRAPHEDHLLPWREMITWPDNSNTDAWYYAAMQEATNSHDYAWTVEDREDVEEWTEKLEERDWAALERTWSDAHDAPGGEVMD